MANMLYNGVELPALPEYDKVKYPYAVIEYINDQGLSGAYLYCTNIPLYYDPTHINSDTAKYHFGDKLAYYSQWGFISNEETLSAFAAMMGVSADTLLAMGYGVGFWFHMYDANELGNLGDSNVIWSSYDIVDFVDDTIHLAASEPVDPNAPASIYDRTAFLSGMAMGLTGKGDPISGMAVSGGGASGGYYSYNGVLLPELPEWDETAFPYAIVASAGLPNGIFIAQLTVSDKPIIVDYLTSTDITPYIQAGAAYAQCGVYSGASESEFESLFGSAFGSIQNIEDGWSAWSDVKTTSVKNWLLLNATWANHNLTFPDGTAYLAASDPAFAGTIKVYYEGTEPTAYSSTFGAFVSTELLNEPGPSVGDSVYVMWDGVLYEDVVTTAAAFGNAPMFGDLTLSARPYVIGYMDIDGNGEAGWFFATGTSGEHTLKVYKLTEASGGSDSFVKGYKVGAALRRKRVIPESKPSANGDGFALYNGVKLPNVMTLLEGEGSYYSFHITKTDLSFMYPDTVVYQVFGGWTTDVTRYYVYTNNQMAADEFGVPAATSVWTEFDVPLLGAYPDYTEGVWQSSEDLPYYGVPIPLDGYTVIEWDGNTEGLEVVDGTFAKVSDDVLTMEQMANSVVAYLEGSTLHGIKLSPETVFDLPDVGAYGTDVVFSAYNTTYCPSVGLYFISAASYGRTTLFAYKA